jgi:hypothetical protein
LLEVEAYKYTIRLAANSVLQQRVGWLLKRPVGAHRTKCAAITPASAIKPGHGPSPLG